MSFSLLCQRQIYNRRNLLADRLRGFAIVVMLIHHLGYDLHVFFKSDLLSFTTQYWFEDVLRPIVVAIFIFLAGVSTHYSHCILSAGRRVGHAALLISSIGLCCYLWFDDSALIIFQVLHVITICLLLTHFCNLKNNRSLVFVLTFVSFMINGLTIEFLGLDRLPAYFLPLGFGLARAPAMADYLPLFPWSGWFWLGILCGKSELWQRRGTNLNYYSTVALLGRHSLIIYLLHQPIFLLILYILHVCGLF